MPQNPENNTQNTSERPIFIQPNKKRNDLPKPLLWIIGCLISCGGILLIFSLFSAGLLAAISSSSSTSINEMSVKDGNPSNKIVIIPINGLITDDVEGADPLSLGSGSVTNSEVTKLLDNAMNDKTVKGVIIRENTPGGSTLAMRKICDKINTVNSDIPVYTYIESEGASAGYYIANCTRFIMADKYAITGSIGALVEATDLQGLMDKLGIKTKVITNTKGVEKNSDLFQSGSNVETKIKAILDDIYEDFIQQIVKGRNTYGGTSKISEAQIRKLATGEIFSGKQAKDNGLVDDNGMLDDVINAIKTRENISSDAKVVQYGYSTGFFGGINSVFKQLLNKTTLPVAYSTIYAVRQ